MTDIKTKMEGWAQEITELAFTDREWGRQDILPKVLVILDQVASASRRLAIEDCAEYVGNKTLREMEEMGGTAHLPQNERDFYREMVGTETLLARGLRALSTDETGEAK